MNGAFCCLGPVRLFPIRHLLDLGDYEIVSLDIAPFSYPEKERITVIQGPRQADILAAPNSYQFHS